MTSIVTEWTATTLLVVGALFPIVNPLGTAPIFLAMTRGLPERSLAALARRVGMNCLFLILASIFVGTYILGFFGISVPVVQVGGGLVVVSTGWTLLRRNDDSGDDLTRPCTEANFLRQAFYPLTLPLTVGPGTISVAITVGASRSFASEGWPMIAGLVTGAIVIAISVYLSYRFAERVAGLLGESAMNVALRLSSFILVCIGVQIMWNGLSALLRTVLPH